MLSTIDLSLIAAQAQNTNTTRNKTAKKAQFLLCVTHNCATPQPVHLAGNHRATVNSEVDSVLRDWHEACTNYKFFWKAVSKTALIYNEPDEPQSPP